MPTTASIPSRSSKRRRTAQDDGGSYHYTLDTPAEEYQYVCVKETNLRLVGRDRVTASSNTQILRTDDEWVSITSWMPEDSTDFALDENGDLYEHAIDASVMDVATGSSDSRKKKKRSQVSVSKLTCLL